MGTVVQLNNSDKRLRDKIEELDICYKLINDAMMQLYNLETKALALEYEYDKELEKHIRCVGRENVAKDLFDYTVEEYEDRAVTAGRTSED